MSTELQDIEHCLNCGAPMMGDTCLDCKTSRSEATKILNEEQREPRRIKWWKWWL